MVSTVPVKPPMPDNRNPLSSFTFKRLPWVIGFASLLLYLVTLHTWVSFASLPTISHIGGWHDFPQSKQPLLYLVTLPLKLLPTSLLPMAVNALSALFGALTLALLARSTAILPHDRTKEQRQREQSEHSFLTIGLNWIPPLFASLICGLQLSFWQHSTSGTGETLNLLLFAYIIRCLLEYRIDHKVKWLTHAAMVCAISIPNNWGMIGFFPLFGIALLWTGRMKLFHEKTWLKLLLASTPCLLLYLLLPLIAVISGSEFTFYEVLTDNLGDQKSFLSNLFNNRLIIMVMACTSILPLLLLGIRWPVNFGDTNAAASAITSFLLRLVHFLFLAACVYTAFDHIFSPRKIIKAQQVVGIGTPFLTFYYLGSLSAGYFLGYLLLLFGKGDARKWQNPTLLSKTINRGAYIGLVVAALITTSTLAWRNIGIIWSHNKNGITSIYSKWLAQKIPTGNTILMSDGDMSAQRELLKAQLASSNRESTPLLINTHRLASPQYHQRLENISSVWPTLSEEVANSIRVDEFLILEKLREAIKKTPIYYTHPSFGYFFEQFHSQPKDGIFQLANYEFNQKSLDKPKLSTNAVANAIGNLNSIKNTFEKFTNQADSLHQANFDDTLMIMGWLSRNLNANGVELSRNNKNKEAETFFRTANDLFKGSLNGNLIAQANLQQLRKLQENPLSKTPPSKELDLFLNNFHKKLDEFLNGQNQQLHSQEIDQILKTYGPLDESKSCLLLGQFFANREQIRQAYHELVRATELTTTDPEPLLYIANMFVTYGMPDKTGTFIDQLKKMHIKNAFTLEQQVQLISIQAGVILIQRDLITAEKYLLEQLRPHIATLPGLKAMLSFYMNNELFEKSLPLLNLWVKEHPDDIDALVGKGLLLSKLKEFDKATSTLETALNKASVSLKSNIRSQLAGVYVEKGDFKTAIKHIEDALVNNKNSSKFRYQKATIFMQMNEHEKAITIFNDLLELNEWNPEAIANRAESYMALKQYSQARTDYQKLQSLTPNDPRMYLRFAQIAKAETSNQEELKNYNLFLKYVDPNSISSDELKQIQNRIKELESSKNETP
ncbi:MAG: tetratricopeptide repeat protein [Verrucomicrobiota bacterium]|nr:tetratricopeptide repeat protein [Verrucomicrobiota bacterium]